jgi:hypothetical protein
VRRWHDGLQVRGAAIGLGSRADDREAKPGAAGLVAVPAARVVEAGEPVEGPLQVGGRDAGPVVGHREHDPAGFAAHRDGHLRLGIPHRVVHEVHEQPVQLIPVAGHQVCQGQVRRARTGVIVRLSVSGRGRHGGIWRLRHDGDPRAAIPLGDAAAQLGQVDRPAGPPRAALRENPLVEAGEQQQVLGQPGEPQRVRVHVPRGRRPVLAVRMVERHLELGADRRDRAAQLVRGIRDQVPLPLLGHGEPVQHVVERQRQ